MNVYRKDLKGYEKIKKIFCGFISAATIMSSVASLGFNVSAYDFYDVNNDGKVDVRDVSAISRYLSGKVTASDYSKLDVNKSLTVDYMDEQCVLAKVMGYSYSSSYYSKKNKTTSTAPAVSNSVLNNDASSTAGRKYRRYSYASKKELSNYTLNLPTSSINSSNPQERAIIGTDDRYASTGSENTGIVYLWGMGFRGTGFIVGDHEIATAAHIAYNTYADTWQSRINISTYKYNGELSDKEFTPVEVHIPVEFDPKKEYNEQMFKYDFALITVKEDLSSYVHFNLGEAYSVNEANFSNIPIYVTGRPINSPSDDGNPTNRLYTGEGVVMSKYVSYYWGPNDPISIILDNTDVLHCDTDALDGNSGGPVYTVTKNIINNKSSYTYTAIAIYDGEQKADDVKYNLGTLVTKYLLQFYKNNQYAYY